ncbi:MAG: fibrillarin-like rRNA/tRNA 2'-O-methyltransferase [Candidatus Aenigmarchaeota archaeon]|nr:fibrillarin-like rRNA/tRNA 2'-O-methyltransferase [Candidatus Aenigmarchaeota archaeon]
MINKNGIYFEGKRIFTVNLVPGQRVYNERLIKHGSDELREWDPTRSKLGAAIVNDMKEMPMKKDSIVLYLGASTGTTVSHVSDIASHGAVYAVEFAERVFRNLLELANHRKNIIPLLGDARKPEEYGWVEQCDVVFCDVADPQETLIAIRNANEFLTSGGYLMISIKSRSIDVTKQPKQIYKEEAAKLREAGFDILEVIDLEPHEKDHCLILARK